MTLSNALYNKAISQLSSPRINALIVQHYSQNFVNDVLYGDVCKYFKNQTFCDNFRNKVFNSGLSILIPTTIKEHADMLNFATVPSDYTIHICDTTTLLF